MKLVMALAFEHKASLVPGVASVHLAILGHDS